MTDFISETTLESGTLALPQDMLSHSDYAETALDLVARLPPGSVIGLQGPWGRGKTDVLARVAKATYDGKGGEGIAGPALWLNPWQYGTTDLLTPLVISLVSRVPESARPGSDKALRKAAASIIRAGASFGLKVAGLTLPGGKLYELAEESVDTLLEGLLGAREEELTEPEPFDPDPVAKMAQRFAELVDLVLPQGGSTRLLVCVDDLDRCLPDSQVALLEAIRFCTSTGARATFLISIDPTLARQAILTHYRSTEFDPDRYLDKMFHHRLTLPSINPPGVDALVNGHLTDSFGGDEPLKDSLIRLWGSALVDELPALAAFALTGDLRNPRLIRRLFTRLFLLASKRIDLGELDADSLRRVVTWLGLVERWPQVRAVLQESGPTEFESGLGRLQHVCAGYVAKPDPELRGGLGRLRKEVDSTDFRELMERLFAGRSEDHVVVAGEIAKLDETLASALV